MSFIAAFAIAFLQQPAEPPKQEPPKPEPAKLNTKAGSTFTLYGFVRLDVLYDTSRPNNTQVPAFIFSEDLSPAGGENDLTIHPRLTRFGLDFDGPTVEELGGAKVTGKLETDFYNLLPAGATSNSREFVRMRHAWLKLGWESFSLLVGQREDVISPLAPTVNNDLVMWNAGNLGDRRPQIRPEYKVEGFTATALVGLTGALDGSTDAATGFLTGEISAMPTLQLRVGYEFEAFVEKKKVNVGAWAHWAKEELDVAVAGEDSFNSTAFGLDITLPIMEQLTVFIEVWTGKNLDDVRGGIAQGIVAGEEVASKGGWIEVHYKVSEVWTPLIGAYLDDPDDSDLLATGVQATHGRDRNLIFAFGNRFKFGPVTMGADVLFWTTEYVGTGIDDGKDTRFNLFAQYNF